MLHDRIVEPCTPWEIQETTKLYQLTIKEGAEIIAPEGKFLTLTVNGVGKPIKPGVYTGDVVVSVTDHYSMRPHGLKLNFGEMFNHGEPLGPEFNTPFTQACVISNNEIVENNTVHAILQDGTVTGTEADGLYVASTEEDFCGFIIEGNSKYTVKNSVFDMEANAHNDWAGFGTAVNAVDNTEVLIENCKFDFAGFTHCSVMAAGDSKVHVKDSILVSSGYDGDEWIGSFSWQVGFRGPGRLTQLSDNADVIYENCLMHGNGWGLLSIDGTGDGKVRPDDPEWPADCRTPGYAVTMLVKDCDMSLSGPRSHGYGAFCIGDNHITYDHTKCDVFGYPVFLMGMMGKGRFDILNGSEITGRRFGAFILDDDNSILNIEDSSFRTGKSCICMKGSSTIIDVKNSTMTAGNGTILQLMDPDESGMNKSDFKVPMYEKDTKDETRDLTTVSPTEDVTMNLTDCQIAGNFFNSTTNIRACNRSTIGGMGRLHDHVLGIVPQAPEGAPTPAMMRHNGNDLRGAFNLGLNLVNSTVTGIVSSASQAYREGLAIITPTNMDELSNVTQTAAPTVNNGVVVTLDAASAWVVTGTSYITALTLAEGAALTAADGKKLVMTVDGAETAIAPGTYTGAIVLSLAD